MTKTILITGATDGIGLEATKKLAAQGHTLLLHGRNRVKMAAAVEAVGGTVESYLADLSRFDEVEKLAGAIIAKHESLDVIINNAGILKTPDPITADGLDIRFVVNTLAPYLLTQRLLPLMNGAGRVVNLSSAAQAPVDVNALAGHKKLADMDAYSQSKLAITMWTRVMAEQPGNPVMIALNPGSLLATKMVKEGFGMAGSDINIGADIIVRAALSEEFADKSGAYFDNDAGQFGPPHRDALDAGKCKAVVKAIEGVLRELLAPK